MDKRLFVDEEGCLDIINFIAGHEETMEKGGAILSQTMVQKNDFGHRRLSIRPVVMNISQMKSFAKWLKNNGLEE